MAHILALSSPKSSGTLINRFIAADLSERLDIAISIEYVKEMDPFFGISNVALLNFKGGVKLSFARVRGGMLSC
jgi:hypothetical protein